MDPSPATARPLDAPELLALWERAGRAPPSERALVLAAGAAGEDPAFLEGLPLGAREARLLALRERVLGPRAEAVAGCPACGALLEAALDLPALRAAAPELGERELRAGEVRVRFRLPSTRDLLRAAAELDERRARTALLRGCVTAAERDGAPLAPDALPGEVLEAVARAIEDGDPLAEIRIALACPECAHRWEAVLDPSAFVMAELRGMAERLLGEVHLLASAYGWSEREILALSPWRRRTYLELVSR